MLQALLLSALKVQLSSARAQELANTLWSASILQLPLSSSWLASFSAACVEQLPTFNAKDLSQVGHAHYMARHVHTGNLAFIPPAVQGASAR